MTKKRPTSAELEEALRLMADDYMWLLSKDPNYADMTTSFIKRYYILLAKENKSNDKNR